MTQKVGAIIPCLSPSQKPQATPEWQRILASAVRDPADLANRLNLRLSDVDVTDAHNSFRLLVPEPYLKKIEASNPRDPLLLQVLPQAVEMQPVPGYSQDPLAEQAASVAPGILHKYHGRILVITTGSCAIHCRYCFRRHYPYQAARPDHSLEQLDHYLATHPEIREVILSGGDPLTLSDSRLATWGSVITKHSHITTLRIHTRLPVVIPQRITSTLLSWLEKLPIKTVVVLHANHPAEIDADVVDACKKLAKHNVTLLNQSVLLKGINDDAETLTDLSERLFSAGVLPYYLHLLDPVKQTAHFDLPEPQAIELITALRARLPGYLVPRLAREEALAPAKTVIAS